MWNRATRFVNCVKIRLPFDTSYKPKAYNKVAETMQQGAVRDQEVNSRFDKRVAHSTEGLKGKSITQTTIIIGRHIDNKRTENSVRAHK